MQYIIKYVDEYNKTHYHDELNGRLIKFASIKDAEEKIEELMADEYEMFSTVITKFYIEQLSETVVKEIKSFKIADNSENNECTLSCTKESANELEGSLAEVKKQYDVKITEDKTYENGSRMLKFTYSKKKKDIPSVSDKNYDAVLIHYNNNFILSFDAEKFYVEVNALARVLMDKYKDDIVVYNLERRNNAGLVSFTLIKHQEDFKKSLLKGAEVFFRVKVVEK